MNKPEMRFLNILFAGVCFILLLPVIQSTFNIFKLEPLSGAYQKSEPAEFSVSDWFSGDFQSKHEKFLEENFGFRNFFIRLNNQLAYNLFGKAKANGVIIGKSGYLYELNYILAYSGKDFIGQDSIRHNLEKLKFIQDYLQNQNKTLLLVLTPGKASFYPEYIPDSYLQENGPRNYDYYSSLSKEIGVNTIDFNGYFVSQKEKSEYPLYPKHGIHWSHYGMCLALDSLVNWLEKARNVDLVNPYWDKINIQTSNNVDSDIAVGMNLLVRPKSEEMAYPELRFKDEDKAVRPSAIVIGDSFYWEMLNLTPRVFNDNHHFWYYNREVHPQKDGKKVNVEDLNIKKELDEHDIIIIMCTEANLSRLGWGFIDKAYKVLKYGREPEIKDFDKKVQETMKYIRSDAKWFESIRQKAKKENISVDSMLMRDAVWIVKGLNI